MPESPAILILGPDAETVAAMAEPVENSGMETIRAAGAREAIEALRGNIGLILVHAATQKPPALEFLAKARELLPHIPRAICRNDGDDLDLLQVIDQAAPHALFANAVDVPRIQTILNEGARLRESHNAAITQAREIKQLQAQIAELQRKGAPSSPTPAAPKPQTAAPAKPKPGNGFSLAGAHTDTSTAQAATLNAIQAAQTEAPEGPGELPTGGDMEIDLMADDQVRELARVMNLMLEEPDLRLPVLPRIGTEVSKLMADPNSSFEQIAEVVGLEPSMSARILEVANSPLYGGKEQIRSVQTAVSRVGLTETRTILQAVAGENMFKTRDKRYAALMAKLWMHSLAVAYSNEILARALFITESDDFFMMGLLHDIGKLLILHLAQKGIDRQLWSKKAADPEVLNEVFRRYHNALGQRLMEKWQYPQQFHEVVSLHNDDQSVHEHDVPVVVTYYSNLLTRKLGFSLREHSEALINNHQIAQALNMSDDARNQIEANLRETLDKLRSTYL